MRTCHATLSPRFIHSRRKIGVAPVEFISTTEIRNYYCHQNQGYLCHTSLYSLINYYTNSCACRTYVPSKNHRQRRCHKSQMLKVELNRRKSGSNCSTIKKSPKMFFFSNNFATFALLVLIYTVFGFQHQDK